MKYFVISKEVILALFKSFIAKCHLSPFLKRGDFFALTCHCRQYFETLCFAHYILMNVGTPYHLLLLLLRPQVYHFRHVDSDLCLVVYSKQPKYLVHVIEQPNLRIPNPQYLQLIFILIFLMILRTHFEASLKFRKNQKRLRDFNL